MELVLTVVPAATMFAKILVDLVRMGYPDRPAWVNPTLAVLFGIGISFLLFMVSDVVFTSAAIAAAVLSGILAGGTAVGVTSLQNNSNKVVAESKTE